MEQRENPIEIFTVKDAIKALDRKRGSFEEWLECATIFAIMVVIDAIATDLGLKETIVEVLTAVDAILLGTVLLVIGYGLYELFIDAEIEVPEIKKQILNVDTQPISKLKK